MTDELTKKFFDTFEIGKEYTYCKYFPDCDFSNCINCKARKEIVSKTYPQITDRILLKLICIATSSEITVEFKGIKNIEHLKEVILNYCIERYSYYLHKDKFKQQVQLLFEETK